MATQLQRSLSCSDQTDASRLAAAYPALSTELRALFRSRGVPSDECADLAQETILRSLTHLRRHGADRDDLGPLVRTIARNLLVERLRRAPPTCAPWPDKEGICDYTPAPDEHLLTAETSKDVRSAVATLAPRHRRAITLWMEGLGPAEIASRLGIKRNAADALLHRARRRLANKLTPHTLGLVAAIWWRVRSGARGLVDATVLPATSAAFAPAAALATLAIAALLSGGPAARPVSHTAMPSRPDAARLSAVAGVEPHVAPARSVPTHTASVSVHSGSGGVGIETDPTGDGATGAGVVYRRDREGERGTVGPMLDRAMQTTCGTLPTACGPS